MAQPAYAMLTRMEHASTNMITVEQLEESSAQGPVFTVVNTCIHLTPLRLSMTPRKSLNNTDFPLRNIRPRSILPPHNINDTRDRQNQNRITVHEE